MLRDNASMYLIKLPLMYLLFTSLSYLPFCLPCYPNEVPKLLTSAIGPNSSLLCLLLCILKSPPFALIFACIEQVGTKPGDRISLGTSYRLCIDPMYHMGPPQGAPAPLTRITHTLKGGHGFLTVYFYTPTTVPGPTISGPGKQASVHSPNNGGSLHIIQRIENMAYEHCLWFRTISLPV